MIAGSGLLPVIVARALAERGEPPFVVVLAGEADDALRSFEHVEMGLGELGRIIPLFKAAGVRRAVLAGGVRTRPRLSSLRFDWHTVSLLPAVIRALGKGDDGLLRALIGFVEARGIRVVGAHEIVPDIVAPSVGTPITRRRPAAADRTNIEAALRAARAIGALDIGQGAVAVGGRVIALEAVEGTDQMLARVAGLRASGRLKAAGGVLVKCAKPRQEERADLPAIGIRTIENAAAAGLSGVAVEAGRSIVLGYRETVEAADDRGLFVTTFDAGAEQ